MRSPLLARVLSKNIHAQSERNDNVRSLEIITNHFSRNRIASFSDSTLFPFPTFFTSCWYTDGEEEIWADYLSNHYCAYFQSDEGKGGARSVRAETHTWHGRRKSCFFVRRMPTK